MTIKACSPHPLTCRHSLNHFWQTKRLSLSVQNYLTGLSKFTGEPGCPTNGAVDYCCSPVNDHFDLKRVPLALLDFLKYAFVKAVDQAGAYNVSPSSEKCPHSYLDRQTLEEISSTQVAMECFI